MATGRYHENPAVYNVWEEEQSHMMSYKVVMPQSTYQGHMLSYKVVMLQSTMVCKGCAYGGDYLLKHFGQRPACKAMYSEEEVKAFEDAAKIKAVAKKKTTDAKRKADMRMAPAVALQLATAADTVQTVLYCAQLTA